MDMVELVVMYEGNDRSIFFLCSDSGVSVSVVDCAECVTVPLALRLEDVASAAVVGG